MFHGETFCAELSTLGQDPPTFTVAPTSPFYIQGIPGVAPGTPLTVQYNQLAHLLPSGTRFFNDNFETSADELLRAAGLGVSVGVQGEVAFDGAS